LLKIFRTSSGPQQKLGPKYPKKICGTAFQLLASSESPITQRSSPSESSEYLTSQSAFLPDLLEEIGSFSRPDEFLQERAFSRAHVL